jgi:hypothetical protein
LHIILNYIICFKFEKGIKIFGLRMKHAYLAPSWTYLSSLWVAMGSNPWFQKIFSGLLQTSPCVEIGLCLHILQLPQQVPTSKMASSFHARSNMWCIPTINTLMAERYNANCKNHTYCRSTTTIRMASIVGPTTITMPQILEEGM